MVLLIQVSPFSILFPHFLVLLSAPPSTSDLTGPCVHVISSPDLTFGFLYCAPCHIYYGSRTPFFELSAPVFFSVLGSCT